MSSSVRVRGSFYGIFRPCLLSNVLGNYVQFRIDFASYVNRYYLSNDFTLFSYPDRQYF